MIADELQRIPMSPFLTATLTRAADYATAQSHREVTLEHLLLALIEDPEASIVLKASDIDLHRLAAEVSDFIGRNEDRIGSESEMPGISSDLRRILEAAAMAAQQGRRREINGAIVLAAIVGDGKSAAAQLLRNQGLTFEAAIRALQRANAEAPPAPQPPALDHAPPRAEPPAKKQRPPIEHLEPAPAYPIEEAHPEPSLADDYAPEPYPMPEEPAPSLDLGEAVPQRWAPPPEPRATPTINTPPRPPMTRTPPPVMTPPFGSRHGQMRDAESSSAPATEAPVARPAPAPAPPPAPAPWSDTNDPFMPAPAGYAPPQAPAPAPAQRGGERSRAPSPSGSTGPFGNTWPLVEQGQLVENIPRRMRAGLPVVVEARIARSDVKALAENLQGGGNAVRHEIVVTKAMSVRLRAPDGGFWIEPRSPETQWIENILGLGTDDYASWRWTVTARERGRRQLQLIVSARTVGSDGLAAETALPDQVIDVRVGINYTATAQKWLGWTAAAVAGGLFARFGETIFETAQVVATRVLGG